MFKSHWNQCLSNVRKVESRCLPARLAIGQTSSAIIEPAIPVRREHVARPVCVLTFVEPPHRRQYRSSAERWASTLAWNVLASASA